MSKRSIRIRRESTTLTRRLALWLPVGFTWLRSSTCTFLRHLAFWDRTEALRAFSVVLVYFARRMVLWPVSLALHVLFEPALHGHGIVVYSILDPWGSDSLLYCTILSVDIHTPLVF